MTFATTGRSGAAGEPRVLRPAPEAADAAVRRGLPPTRPVTRVSLFAGTDVPGSWSRLRTFPLGSRA